MSFLPSFTMEFMVGCHVALQTSPWKRTDVCSVVLPSDSLPTVVSVCSDALQRWEKSVYGIILKINYFCPRISIFVDTVCFWWPRRQQQNTISISS